MVPSKPASATRAIDDGAATSPRLRRLRAWQPPTVCRRLSAALCRDGALASPSRPQLVVNKVRTNKPISRWTFGLAQCLVSEVSVFVAAAHKPVDAFCMTARTRLYACAEPLELTLGQHCVSTSPPVPVAEGGLRVGPKLA